MSLITYEEVSRISIHPSITILFLLPFLLRVLGGFFSKDPASGLLKRSYIYFAFLSVTTLSYIYFANYPTFLLVLGNLHIVLLTITTVNKIQVPHYLEFFNTVSFFTVFWTPALMWAGLVIIWFMNALRNLMCGRIFGVILALIQIASGILAFGAGVTMDLDAFFWFSGVSLALMIGQVDLFKN